ncbi:unnamed protein product [Linum trigynum]|uniref:Uncharacterized protein n=1 Tax=Linum trigynum TaxID=586398 RepID=A0AAV2DXP1_9ROSI
MAGAGRTGAVARWDEEAAEVNPPAGGEEAGATRALAAAGGAPGSSAVQLSRAGEPGTLGARSAPAPAFSGPGLLPTPTDPTHDKTRGKQKMTGYEGESWPTGPNGKEPWPIGPGEEEGWSFGDPEGWVDPSPEEGRGGGMVDPQSARTGQVSGRPAGRNRAEPNQTGSGRVNHRWAVAGAGWARVSAGARSTGTPRGVRREEREVEVEDIEILGRGRGPSPDTAGTIMRWQETGPILPSSGPRAATTIRSRRIDHPHRTQAGMNIVTLYMRLKRNWYLELNRQ